MPHLPVADACRRGALKDPHKQMIGISFNHYQITAKIGAGGMGEVYRAHDPRLARDVAVKILPSEFASDGGRLKRFEQEAKTLAALNHPNILSIFDMGVHESTPYLVSELLEGQTLREVLGSRANSPLPLRRATDFALQMAQGLAAAHAREIIHRDLKPENIFITRDGRVKILDFGLAKLRRSPRTQIAKPDPAIDEDAPTLVQSTEPGMVLGSAGYMPPEQVRGEEADHRSDIFSFGCILYEMLSGRRAFRKDSAVETMSAILTEEPRELEEANPDVPPALARIAARCLGKNPEERFQSAKDLAFALEALTSASSSHLERAAAVNQPSRAKRAWKWAFGGMAALALVLLGVVAGRLPRPSGELPASWVEISPPHERFASHPAAAISPDGRQIVFWAPDQAGRVGLWIRSLDSPAARLLPGTDSDNLPSGIAPFWSPDGRSIGFFADRKLKRIDVATGTPLILAEAGNPRGGSWGANGAIVFVPVTGGAVCRISASGGEVTPLSITPAQNASGFRWPYFLPDGRHFLVNDRVNGVFLAALDEREVRRLSTVDSRVEYADGRVFFGRNGNLFAQPFDEEQLKLSGEPLRVAENLGLSAGDVSNYAFSVSPRGTMVYCSSLAHPITQLTWFSRAGDALGTVGERSAVVSFALSPSGRQVMLNRHDPTIGGFNLWLVDMATGATSKFTSGAGPVPVSAGTPVWFPTEDQVLFRSFPGVARQSLGGGEPAKLSDESGFPTDISPDGRYALILKSAPTTGSDLWLLTLIGDKSAKPYLATKQNEGVARFSPDGRWVAYHSDDTGSAEVYVQSFPEKGRPKPISAKGGIQPQWRKDGKELYFLSPDDILMAAAVDGTAPLFEASRAQPLFKVHVPTRGILSQYQPSNDGQRFLVNTLSEQSSVTPRTLTVVMNWQSLVKKK